LPDSINMQSYAILKLPRQYEETFSSIQIKVKVIENVSPNVKKYQKFIHYVLVPLKACNFCIKQFLHKIKDVFFRGIEL